MNNREIIEKLNHYHSSPKIKVGSHYEAAPAPAQVPVAKPSKLDIYLASLPQPTMQEITYPNGRKTYGYR